MICKNCNGAHARGDHDSGGACAIAFCPCNNWEPIAEPAAAAPIVGANVPKQLTIDLSNLRFYASLFREKKWGTDVICWNVFEATLNEIAERLSLRWSKSPLDPPAIVEPVKSGLADFPIETASFAELAVWAYKARNLIRRIES